MECPLREGERQLKTGRHSGEVSGVSIRNHDLPKRQTRKATSSPNEFKSRLTWQRYFRPNGYLAAQWAGK